MNLVSLLPVLSSLESEHIVLCLGTPTFCCCLLSREPLFFGGVPCPVGKDVFQGDLFLALDDVGSPYNFPVYPGYRGEQGGRYQLQTVGNLLYRESDIPADNTRSCHRIINVQAFSIL